MKSNGKNDKFSSNQKYVVEHLTTFGFGEEFGLTTITDGLNHWQEIRRFEKIDRQEMLLGFVDDTIEFRYLDNNELIECFSLKFVSNQFAYVDEDENDEYNNLLIFVVNPDRTKKPLCLEEMHIFRCISHHPGEIMKVFQNELKKVRKAEKPYDEVIDDIKPKKISKPIKKISTDNKLSPRLSDGSRNSSSQDLPTVQTVTIGLTDSPTSSKSSSLKLLPKSSHSELPSKSSSPKAEFKSDSSKRSSSNSSNSSPKPTVSVINEILLPLPYENPIIYPTYSYTVELLATFDFGLQYGVPGVEAGVQKLITEEKSRPIWVQQVILRVKQHSVKLQDLDKKTIGQFRKSSMSNIFACYSETIRNVYNNLLIFVVNDEKHKPPQLYIFQCVSHSAKEIATQIKS